MIRVNRSGLLVLLLLALGSMEVFATALPEWAWKEESFMNKKRKNTTYVFKVFKTEDSNLTRLREGCFYPLLKFLGERYNADPASMVVDSLSDTRQQRRTYTVSFPDNGRRAVVYAQRVDDFSAVDYDVNQNPVFEYYQLYAVSEKDVQPIFDVFEEGVRSKKTAAMMNIIPGAGQLYKGQTFRGYSILGSEVALGAAAITFHARSNYFGRKKNEPSESPESFHSKQESLSRLRNTTLCAMAGIWAFSIVDALVSDSMPNITVSAPQDRQISIVPAPQSAGIAIVYRF